ncbi:MAG TPA: hypothetical protein VKA26_15595 [Ignavibacteriaceae bacterium]|nr:hypothetical protein [Ignavibacteriaceae bacterium]
MKSIIIGIHGIGNKPPAGILKEWWLKSIYEGFRKQNLKIPSINFEMAYWADILHKSSLDPNETDRKNPAFMEEKYIPGEAPAVLRPIGFRQKAIEYLERYYDKFIVDRVLSLNNESITELFIHLHMKDLESYYSPTYLEFNGKKELTREIIINRFYEMLKKHRDKKIMIIAHSMGSIIAHDTLIEKAADIKIDTLVTIGSPLGQKYVIDNYKKEEAKNSFIKLNVPEKITGAWYNFADLEDQVAINHKLAELYGKNSKGVRIQDKLVKNNYSYEGHINPHKSFGYLRTPEMVEIMNSFARQGKIDLYGWIKDELSKFFTIK